VDVLEAEHERLSGCDALNPLAHGPRDLLAGPIGLGRLLDARREREQVCDSLVPAERAQLLPRLLRRVVVDDPR
jgi:hypothetical protein